MKKQRYWLYRRVGIYYLHDAQTGARESLKTRRKTEAEQIRTMRNMAAEHPVIGISLAKACLTSQDPKLLSRTWQEVMNEFCSRGKPQTQAHRRRVAGRKPQHWLKNMKLIETTADDLVKILKAGGVMTNAFVRCLQNLAVGLGWLPWPILPPRLWPKVEFKKKRAITSEEHERIVETENNTERRRYYEMLWETGAAQTDAALLRAECIDWQRQKTGEWAHLQIGKRLEELLRLLPSEGLLFPAMAHSNNSARSSEFCRRCRLLHIQGISLHSYRYAWAQRACIAGYPERFAQDALGHNSSAVHRAYARGARVVVPSLEDYERRNQEEMGIPQSETNSRQLAGVV